MKLDTLFLKDVNRPIETVIKADDQDHVLTEVEEYVVTQEIAKKITNFFAAYNDYQNVNGVWISGFFGSGKSHLLKILSYVLENKAYEEVQLGEVFAAKIEGDDLLKADVLRATRIPSESILFNIDQQAQITSKSDEDAILNVFYKVFNDHQGYFGTQRHVAEFERWLDQEGHYRDFMERFETFAGEHWTVGRRKYFAPKTKDAIAQALGEIHQDDPAKYRDILDTLRKDNRISVEDFSEKVAAYIATKPKGFRLNFYVDEVGQFISDNTKLMLNLQTIAETLATKCQGHAWVFATAQEDLEAIVGDNSSINSDDFSKIQGRFKLRISLTSANVDEVIEKRLLAKTDPAEQQLGQNWATEQANLSTILSFSEAGVQFRKFRDEHDYVRKFPFVPYQFDLFQQCIRELSKHNAFQGRHASIGERSMLGVFQEVLKNLGKVDTTTLVSFDQMFEGIRSTIRGEIQIAITLAEKNIVGNPLALRILKALFLVKYYSNFKTNTRNISVMMLQATDADLKIHEANVQEALNLLERQTYIQRNGELYEFLTDDEKDVENEIKTTDIDQQQITHFFNEVLFDGVIADNRIRFIENKQDYEFTKRIDGATVGRDKELTLEIITPNSPYYGQETYYEGQTMGVTTKVLFVLPQAPRLLQDIHLYLKTEKYHRLKRSSTNNETLSRIIYEKQASNVLRKKQLITLLDQLLGQATVYLNGTRHEVSHSSDGKTKVIKAFQDLVKLAYSNLRMLGKLSYDESTLKTIMRSKQDDLFGSDEATVSEAESEVYNYILRRRKQADRTSITDLKDHFSKKPYGWYTNALLCMCARLYKRGKVEARQDANLLSEEDFLNNLLNNRTFSNTLLEPQVEFDQRLIKQLKDLYQELFDETAPVSEARDLAQQFKQKARDEARELYKLLGNATAYPFLSALQPLAKLLERLGDMDYSLLIQQVDDFEDQLLDPKEQLLDPIRKFWNGEQKKIFDRVNTFLNGDRSNFEYVDASELERLREVQAHERPYQGSILRDARVAMEKLQQKVADRIREEKEKTLEQITQAKAQLVSQPDFGELSAEQQQRVTQPLERLAQRVQDQRYIASIRQHDNQVSQLVADSLTTYQKLLRPDAPTIKYITISNVKVNSHHRELTTPEEVAHYVSELQAELLRHLEANRRIKL
ncbi:BREX system P-loop protein BrxC [Lewinella cohaerens]|uniref:BREX system P-loop protein BrxC n=1 Tax=Lewinella cohaerens TaxID=70995 RepID=UPI00036950FB|nr:BREX system P-loop protein BrxC [Lewinella cohaerens]